jgi:hypothetical protein
MAVTVISHSGLSTAVSAALASELSALSVDASAALQATPQANNTQVGRDRMKPLPLLFFMSQPSRTEGY